MENKTESGELSQMLSVDVLTARLALHSPDLVEEIFKFSKEYLASETAREVGLNGKAVSLLTASGLSMTVAFTFGGLLLQKPEYLDVLGSWWALVVAVLYGFSLSLGFGASFVAVQALLVRGDYVGLDGGDVFRPEVLVMADSLDLQSLPATKSSSADVGAAEDGAGVDDTPRPPFPKTGTAYYRRFMAAHVWQIAQKHFEIHEEKARLIRLGQIFFLWFLGLLALIGVALAVLVFVQQSERIAARQSVAFDSSASLRGGE